MTMKIKFLCVVAILFFSCLWGCASDTSNYDVIPGSVDGNSNEFEDSTLIWLLPDGFEIDIDSMNAAVNRKLSDEGYSFRVKFVICPMDSWFDYNDKSMNERADIAWIGICSDGVQDAESLIASGEFVCLDEYLVDSDLIDVIPKVFWDATRYNGHLYSIPNTTQTYVPLYAYFNTKKIDESVIDGFDGDVFELLSLVPKEEKFQWTLIDSEIMAAFGYCDMYNGIICDEQGTIFIYTEDERYVQWEECMDEMFLQGRLMFHAENERPAIGICSVPSEYLYDDDYRIYYFHESPSVPSGKYAMTTGIRSGSDKKEEAFKLLELVYTNPDYGNLVLYGTLDEQEASSLGSRYWARQVLGLNDFLFNPEIESTGYFATKEERNEYYRNAYVIPKLNIYADKQEAINELVTDIALNSPSFRNDIAFESEFEGDWEKYNEALTEYRERIRAELKAIAR